MIHQRLLVLIVFQWWSELMSYLICGNNNNWLLNLNLIFEILDWSRKWLVDFNAGKTQLVSFDFSNNAGVTDLKIDGFVLEERLYFKMLGLSFSFNIISIATTAAKEIRALVLSMKFFLLRLLCISINLPYIDVWNTVAPWLIVKM